MKAPLPLEGEGAGGWGGGTPSPATPEDTAASSFAYGVLSAQEAGRASTPPKPSPPGEGFGGFDRFIRTPKIRDGATRRARKLRSEPTHAEAKLWKGLRQLEIRFRRQAPIGPYVVDFACHPARLVIEVDGGIHDRADVALRDLVRDEWLTSQGYRILRMPNRRVEDEIEAVVAEIAKAAGVFVPPGSVRASTPSQPFPLEGKGSSED